MPLQDTHAKFYFWKIPCALNVRSVQVALRLSGEKRCSQAPPQHSEHVKMTPQLSGSLLHFAGCASGGWYTQQSVSVCRAGAVCPGSCSCFRRLCCVAQDQLLCDTKSSFRILSEIDCCWYKEIQGADQEMETTGSCFIFWLYSVHGPLCVQRSELKYGSTGCHSVCDLADQEDMNNTLRLERYNNTDTSVMYQVLPEGTSFQTRTSALYLSSSVL